jgi:hypothetical protein
VSERAARITRTAAGAILAAGLVSVLVVLVPSYRKNSRFQEYLEQAVTRPGPPAILKTDIVNRAAQMGLPLRDDDVRITEKPGNHLRVDIVYVDRVDLKLYTVDLHFHPSAER